MGLKMQVMSRFCVIIFFLWQWVAFTYEEKPIVVVIPSYNNEKWVENNLTSVFNQKYENYRVIYVDDCSTDNTYALVQELVATYHQQERVTVIHNQERCGAMANWYRAIHMCPDNAIIVQLDGDDWLACDTVLAYLNKIYSESDIWTTYGQFMEHPTGIKYYEYSKRFDEQVIQDNSFRKVEQLPMSHLRTCYAWLFKSIKLKDVLYNGNFYPMTCDKVIMACCIEMAARHHYCIPDILYVWNNTNSLSDHRVNGALQWALAEYVLSLPPYEQLDAPKKVDELDALDSVSLIFVCLDKLSEEIVNTIIKHKAQYDTIFVLVPDDQIQETSVANGYITVVSYAQSDLRQQIQHCLQQIKGRYVLLSTQIDSLAIDTTLCAKLLKEMQVDLLFNCAVNDPKITQIIQDKKFPRVSYDYRAYAWYPKNYNVDDSLLIDCGVIYRKQNIAEIVGNASWKSLKDMREVLYNYVQKNEELCLLLLH